MKIKQETISNFLLLANLAVIITAFFLLQNLYLTSKSATLLEHLKSAIEADGLYLLILLITESVLFIALFFSSQRALNNSNANRPPISIEELAKAEKVNEFSPLETKEEKVKKQFKHIESQIEKLNDGYKKKKSPFRKLILTQRSTPCKILNHLLIAALYF